MRECFQNVVNRIAEIAKEKEIEPSLLLFGSCARNEEILSSDIDIAVVWSRGVNGEGRNKFSEVMDMFEDGFPRVQFVHVKREDVIKSTGNFDVCTHIKKEGILLWGDPI